MKIHRALTGALCCAAAVTAHGAASDDDSGRHGPIEQVVVTSHPLSAEGLALSSEVLEGDELSRKLESSVAETIGREPGVHAASFGQAASRPVIHGLSGPRVRLMEDRIAALDVSVTSADHAVTIEPFIADRIEVLKGPSTLLYGSGAIGGVVDVHTGRIPHDPVADPLSGRVEARLSNNGDRKTAAGRLDGGGGSLAWHLDGFSRESDPYEIPGFAESRALRALEAAAGEAVSHDAAEGRLPGSGLKAAGGAAGLSRVGERGFAGLAVSRMTADYGLPGGHGHGHEDDARATEDHVNRTPRVDLEQTRLDLEAGLADPLPGFQSLNLRIGVNDYRHLEIEADGAVGTTFDNEAVEARLELTHRPLAGWSGSTGLQYTRRDLSAAGAEAFIEPAETAALGAFWVGQRSFSRFDLEGGVRLERVEVDPRSGPGEDFGTGAVSLGMILPFGEAWSLGLVADYASRAPIAEELYSFGPHLTTGSFEVGNPGLDPERSASLSANVRYAGERWFFNGTAYYNHFADFIYEAPTGEERDGLPVFAYTQHDARFTGFEAEVRATMVEWQEGELTAGFRFDTVSGEVDRSRSRSGDRSHRPGDRSHGNGNLPRVPPTRYAVSLSGRWGILRASVDHLWVRAQDQVADFELPTGAYRDLRAFVGADVRLGGGVEATLFVQGRNLTDDDQRQHTSFIKDLAPLPGRSVEAGLRVRF